jgi:hypothetical protein
MYCCITQHRERSKNVGFKKCYVTLIVGIPRKVMGKWNWYQRVAFKLWANGFGICELLSIYGQMDLVSMRCFEVMGKWNWYQGVAFKLWANGFGIYELLSSYGQMEFVPGSCFQVMGKWIWYL